MSRFCSACHRIPGAQVPVSGWSSLSGWCRCCLLNNLCSGQEFAVHRNRPLAQSAGEEYIGMSIFGEENKPAESFARYLQSPTLLAAAHEAGPLTRHLERTPLPLKQPIVKKADKKDHIRVIDLFDQWRAQQMGPFTEDSLAPFKTFCMSELTRQGYGDVSRIFSKQPKAIVGTQWSRADRLHHRIGQTKANFVCPLIGCGSQCTRKHNLNRKPHVTPSIYTTESLISSAPERPHRPHRSLL